LRRIDVRDAEAIRMTSKPPVSVLVPTRNEERALPACLASLDWADEVFVFDSYSQDGTEAVARAAGAHWVQRVFDDFATHKNWALDNLEFKNNWILIVDADERIPPQLAKEIEETIASPEAAPGYYVARRKNFAGKWLRHGGTFPDYNLRLFRRGACRYEKRLVHEHMVCDGTPGYLKTALLHEDYKGIERYIDRQNAYSSFEAVEAYKLQAKLHLDGQIRPSIWRVGPYRRRALKSFAYRHLPLRSLFFFFWVYFIKLGFLDGRIGLRYCILRAIYEYEVDLKIIELNSDGSPIREKYAGHITAQSE